MVATPTLPDEPGPEEIALSAQLTRKILGELRQEGGWMSFERFMELALYAPGAGYYSAGMRKFGAQGDYITAPLLGNLFARSLAEQFGEILGQLPDCPTVSIVEYGAGNGQLACDLLESLAVAGRLPDQYLVVETSADLQQRQKQAIGRLDPGLSRLVEWVHELPEGGVDGIVFANELLDAMPAMRFEVSGDGQIMEQGVGWSGNSFDWHRDSQPVTKPLQQRMACYEPVPGYRSEIGRIAEAWVQTASSQLRSGALILVDYGFPGHEFYHPDRSDGSLMCHFRHHAHSNPFRFPGLQDITVHVDFSAIADAGTGSGLDLAGFCSQGSFLLSLDILDMLENESSGDQSTASRLALTQQVKKLTLPHEMGELFKVIAFTRKISPKLKGFSMADKRSSL